MKSKLIATMVKAVIDLRLLVGYKLVTLDSLKQSNLSATKQLDALRADALHWQDRSSQLSKRISVVVMEKETAQALAQVSIEQLKKDKDKLVKDFHDTSAKLMDATNEVEIANSEMLILRASLDEGTELSKQLKEALDRWTS